MGIEHVLLGRLQLLLQSSESFASRSSSASLAPSAAASAASVGFVLIQFHILVVHLISLDKVCAVKSTMGITRA
jgi:hypothetical protein